MQQKQIMNRNQYVSPRGDQWIVKPEGSDRATRVFERQSDAINAARGFAKNQKTELIIKGRDGRIRARDSYGNDPFPPRG